MLLLLMMNRFIPGKFTVLIRTPERSSGRRTPYTGVPAIKRHPKSTHANTSVAVDGKYAVAFFGSEGLYCYDFDGNLQWQKNFGVLSSAFFIMKNAEWEFASSPIIHDGKVIIQCDVLENSFLAAYDVKTGKELWKAERDEYPGWCTPNIYYNNGKPFVAVNGFKHRGGYDALKQERKSGECREVAISRSRHQ